jgi:hypothetical protein
VVDWGRLLSGYWGEIFSRRFESCPPRLMHDRKNAFQPERVFVSSQAPMEGMLFESCAVRPRLMHDRKNAFQPERVFVY